MSIHNENNPDNGIKVFRMNQMCMPFLFLCRHTIELDNDDFDMLIEVLNTIDVDGDEWIYRPGNNKIFLDSGDSNVKIEIIKLKDIFDKHVNRNIEKI